MLFSGMCKLAIKSVIYIATRFDQPLTIKEISTHLEASEHTIAKILQVLSKHEIISSLKGVHGGFFMSEEQTQFPILKIVKLIDGEGLLNQCVLGLSQCNAKKPCPLHEEYVKAKYVIEGILTKKSIAEFSALVNKGQFNLVN